MPLDVNGDLQFNKNENTSRDIGNRLLALNLIQLTIHLAGKLAILGAIVWSVTTVIDQIKTTNQTGTTQAALKTDCNSPSDRIQFDRRTKP